LRKKWNANRQTDSDAPKSASTLQKLRYIYWEKLPESKVELLFSELKGTGIQAEEITKES